MKEKDGYIHVFFSIKSFCNPVNSNKLNCGKKAISSIQKKYYMDACMSGVVF